MKILDSIDFLVKEDRNKANIRFLKNSIEHNNISHAYLFSGNDIDKLYKLSLSFSASINCLEGGCGSCKVCKDTLSGIYPDIITIEADGNILTLDKIVELQNFMSLTSYNPGRKIGIIKDAEILNEEASNRLLKTLEDPPDPRNVIILLSEDTRPILPTVVSRCLVLDWNLELGREKIDEIYFIELEDCLNEGIKNLVYFSRGSISKNFSYSLNLSAKLVDILRGVEEKVRQNLEKNVKEIEKSAMDKSEVSAYIKVLKSKNERKLKKISNLGVSRVFDIISAWLEDIYIVKLGLEDCRLNYRQNYDLIRESFRDVDINEIFKLLDTVEENRSYLSYSLSIELSLDNILVQFQNLVK